MYSSESVPNPSHKRLGLVLIVVGLLFAVDNYYKLSIVHLFWPLLISALGVGLIGISFKFRSMFNSFYLAIGAYLVCFSGLALYCNFTSWSKLSFGWPLFIAFFGVVFVLLYLFGKKIRVKLFLGLFLISLSLTFIIIFSQGRDYWWTSFLLFGFSVLIASRAK